MAVDTPDNAVLTLALPDYPGWQATIDGTAAPISGGLHRPERGRRAGGAAHRRAALRPLHGDRRRGAQRGWLAVFCSYWCVRRTAWADAASASAAAPVDDRADDRDAEQHEDRRAVAQANSRRLEAARVESGTASTSSAPSTSTTAAAKPTRRAPADDPAGAVVVGGAQPAAPIPVSEHLRQALLKRGTRRRVRVDHAVQAGAERRLSSRFSPSSAGMSLPLSSSIGRLREFVVQISHSLKPHPLLSVPPEWHGGKAI